MWSWQLGSTLKINSSEKEELNLKESKDGVYGIARGVGVKGKGDMG